MRGGYSKRDYQSELRKNESVLYAKRKRSDGMKKIINFFMITILFLGLVACSSNSNTTSSSNEDSNNNESEKKEVFNLVASTHSPPGIPLTKAWDAFLDEIEKRSEGQITFERYYNGSLAGGFDVIDAIGSGVADLAIVFPGWQSGKLALNDVGSIPALHENAWPAIKALNELQRTIPELNKEIEGHGVVNIGNFGAPPFYFISTKALSDFDDLKGLQVLTNSAAQAAISGKLGMTPVGMNLTDAYDALTRGTVDTVLFSAQGAMSFGLQEKAKHAWRLPMGTMSGLYGMNKDKWDSLPEELQNMITEVKEDFQANSFHEIYQIGEEAFEQKFIDAGGNIVEPSEEDYQYMIDVISKTVWEEWIKGMNEKGLPGEKVLNTYKDLVGKYEKENPFK
jgi:TRAP-type transport system periplasmic protein